ncbi:MAG: DUF1015 domain-containing protein [Oscillospiraceae bacterium]|nr:DUF1015 domain-containing protein [Oscillospiraceae bacterium]
MAEIKPFCALRFTEKAGLIQELCCPPYDIINEEQRQQFLKTNPNNVIRLELPKDGKNPYETAGETLKQWIDEGVVAVDGAEAIYIYEEAFTVSGKTYAFKGFISRVKLEEFSKGIVLPHEQTLSKAKTDRFNLMCTTSSNFSQIYSLYIDELGETPKLLDEMSKSEPISEFCDADGVTHRLWICTDVAKCRELSRQFADRKLYIADGHHRYETGINYRNHMRETVGAKEGDDCDYIMMMLVDMQNDGLVVFPTHRIIKDINNFDSASLIEKCLNYFELESCRDQNDVAEKLKFKYNQGKKAFGYFDGKEYKLLTLKMNTDGVPQLKELDPSLRTLDVSVLHTLILENLLGIDKENMANQINLKYTRDAQEAVDSVNNGSANCCFIINPTRISEIADVAAAGEKMPQKSTYFYPKLITGLVMNKMN